MACVALLLTASPLAGGRTLAQVRPLVLEDSSRPAYRIAPPRFPLRRAEMTMLWEEGVSGTIIDGGLTAGPGGIILATREGTIALVSAGDGTEAWGTQMGAEIEHPPAAAAGQVIVGTPSELVSLSSEDGTVIWRLDLLAPLSQPVSANASMAVCALSNGTLMAVDLGTGTVVWNRLASCDVSTPFALSERLGVHGCSEGRVLGLDIQEGRVLWDRQLDGAVVVQPGMRRKRVYTGTDARTVHALSSKNGRVLYSARVAGAPASPLMVRDGLLFVGSQDNLLYAFRRRQGHLVWTADTHSRVFAAPAVRGTFAVVSPPLSQSVLVVDIQDGAVLLDEKLAEDRMSAANPVFAGGTVVSATRPTGGGAGWLTAYRLKVEVQDDPASGRFTEIPL